MNTTESVTNQTLQEKDSTHYLQTFKRFPIAFERGEGCYLWDVEGKKYLDALAGIAVNNVGHCHPHVTQAIQEQAAKLVHISNFFVSKPQMDLAEKLTSLSGLERVFFTNSGAESLEGAIKIARKYAHTQNRGGTIISFEQSFHGRTLATIATGKKKMQEGFAPIPSGFKKARFNDIDSVRELADDQTAAIVIEPIQGEGGINVADKQFLKELRAFCDQENIVLIFDEVQCGVGRTGHWFAKDYFGVQPDIMTLAKGLGGGVPIGAILSNQKTSDAIDYGDHGTTFGGNPLVCASALATIEVIENEKLLENAQTIGNWFVNQLKEANISGLSEVRGLGLMLGLQFDCETKPMVAKMLENGVIVNATGDNVMRIVPPLIINQDEIGRVIKAIKKVAG